MIRENAKVALSLSIFFVSSFLCPAQNVSPNEKKLSAEEEKEMDKGRLLLEEKNYRLALPLFENLIRKNPDDPRLKYFTAQSYIVRPDKHQLMLQYFNDVYAANIKAEKINFYLARANFYNCRFEEAAKFLDQFRSQNEISENDKKEIEQLARCLENARQLASKPLDVKIVNMGALINTSASENSPYVSDDDSTLIFTYRGEQSTGGMQNAFNEGVEKGLYYEDVFISRKQNGKWSAPQSVNAVNSNNNDEALCFSHEGQKMYVSRDNEKDDGDIYVSNFSNGGWTEPVKLSGDVNSPSWDDNCVVSADGKTMFFSSTRPGGFGGKDLYMVRIAEDGTWSHAKNLGDKINTADDEDDPFFHLDGKLLLFSSKGHNGMGGYDVFKTYLNPADSSWSIPENLGYPVNSPNDEVHYVISPSGETGYLAISKAEGFGDYDLYTVEPGITGTLPAVLVLKGSVSANNAATRAEIVVNVNNSEYRRYASNPETGFYQAVLPLGKDYEITWKTNGAPSQTLKMETAGLTSYMLKIYDVNFSAGSEPVTQASPVNETKNDVAFKIQISAEKLRPGLNTAQLRPFGKIEKNVVDKVARFTLDTKYSTLEEANVALAKVKAGPVPDAFVVCNYNKKRYYVYELRNMGVIK